MSIGFDSAKVPPVTSVDDLLKPEYKGKVALNGDPTQAGAAFSGVLMVALSQGGSADDIAPGVEFFGKLKEAGNFLPVDPTPATIESGQTPVVIDWNYLNAAETEKLPTLAGARSAGPRRRRLLLPGDQPDAPHPAAARLWQEFLYSDEGQNLYAGGWRPAGPRRHDGRRRAPSTRPPWTRCPSSTGPGRPCRAAEQTEKATKYLADNWAKAIG